MARRKETIWQNDFSFGAVRPEAVERDDAPLITSSSKEAENTVVLSTGQCEIRPGTIYENETASRDPIEVDLGSGRVYELHITPTGLVLYDSDGAVAYSNTLTTWTAITGLYGSPTFSDIDFWVVPDPDTSAIIIGSKYFPAQELSIASGSWALAEMEFDTDLAGAVLQPYWPYERGVTIQPSGRTGSITVTASSGVWTDEHNGTIIRYVDRQIELGSKVSDTVINATVIEELPQTWTITVASASGFQKGEAVEHEALGGQGIITDISGADITVLATSKFEEFAGSSNLVGPNSTSAISGISSASPAATFLWDQQMCSPVYGYAGFGARHQSRMMLCDFPGAPQAFAASAPGLIRDFTLGADDDNGFVETVGADLGGALKYLISAEDLLFMTTRGLYYQLTRDGTALTPRSIRPVRFSRMGCASVRPIAVDDGAVFIDAIGQQVYGAVLVGDVYTRWSVIPLTRFHSQVISSPVRLGATQSGAERPEQFVFVLNADGSAAVAQWDRADNKVSWRPWTTDGEFIAIYQAFGRVHCVVDRTINSVAKSLRERFEYGIYMDCTAVASISTAYPEGEAGVTFDQGVTALANHLNGETASVYFEGWDMGDFTVSAGKPVDGDGNVIDYPDGYEGYAQVGLNFTIRFTPWSRRSIRTQKGTRRVKRMIELFIGVQDSTGFEIDGQEFGFYVVGEDLTAPPPFRDKTYRLAHIGEESFEEKTLTKSRPGPFRILKLGYRVVV